MFLLLLRGTLNASRQVDEGEFRRRTRLDRQATLGADARLITCSRV
jgi:hypothetical protein